MVLNAFAGLAGALVLAAAPVASAVPPVTVVSCDYTSQLLTSGETGIWWNPPFEVSNLRITFVNRAPLEATDVRFAATYGGVSQTVDDRGHFAPATPIVRDVQPLETGTFRNEAAHCAVESVTFSGGSTWRPS
jgi:hypothetical protein